MGLQTQSSTLFRRTTKRIRVWDAPRGFCQSSDEVRCSCLVGLGFLAWTRAYDGAISFFEAETRRCVQGPIVP